MNTLTNPKARLLIPTITCWQSLTYYGDEARIDSEGYVKRTDEHYRNTPDETGHVTVTAKRSVEAGLVTVAANRSFGSGPVEN
ncbi:MAG: hypothetical protein WBE28_03845 [bacterium]